MLRDWSHDFADMLSLVSLQIDDWLSAEIFENSVRKSAEQIPLRVLQWFSQS